MSGDTEREALAKLIYGAIAFHGGDPEHYEAMRDGIYHDAADAILAEFLPAHDERVRAEQREADIAAVIAAAPPINAELSPITGAVEDAGMAAYIEGFHDAWAAIREASDD